jgi:hypothetical protein
MNTIHRRVSTGAVVCVLVIGLSWFSLNVAWSKEPPVSRVIQLTHLAVILPAEKAHQASDYEAWNPTVEQVMAAEKAVLRYMGKPATGTKRSRPKEQYMIQYYGVLKEKKRWIVCGVYRMDALKNRAIESKNLKLGNFGFSEIVITLLTYPYQETDTDDWFDVFYDPSTNEISDSLGTTTDEGTKIEGRNGKKGPIQKKKIKEGSAPKVHKRTSEIDRAQDDVISKPQR